MVRICSKVIKDTEGGFKALFSSMIFSVHY